MRKRAGKSGKRMEIEVVRLRKEGDEVAGLVYWDGRKFSFGKGVPAEVRKCLQAVNRRGFVHCRGGGEADGVLYEAVGEVTPADKGFLRAVGENMPPHYLLRHHGEWL